MKKFNAMLLAVLLTGCVHSPLSLSSDTCFRSTDVLLYNHLFLTLNPDGLYAAEILGDIGMKATVRGSWSERGSNIAFAPEVYSGKEFLNVARRAEDGTLVVEPIPGQYDYKWDPLQPTACRPHVPVGGYH